MRAWPRSSDGHVLIYIHKEEALDDVERRYPGRALRSRRRQAAHPGCGQAGLGRARDDGVRRARASMRTTPKVLSALPPADVTIERIGDLLDYDLPRLRTARTLASSLKVTP